MVKMVISCVIPFFFKVDIWKHGKIQKYHIYISSVQISLTLDTQFLNTLWFVNLVFNNRRSKVLSLFPFLPIAVIFLALLPTGDIPPAISSNIYTDGNATKKKRKREKYAKWSCSVNSTFVGHITYAVG